MSTGRVHEVKVNQVIDPQLLQLQNHGAQIGAEYLRVSVVLHLVLIGLLWSGEIVTSTDTGRPTNN